ncbi:MAG: cohesin domain-containing protein [Candidatus Shapirobacteria bacterium]
MKKIFCLSLILFSFLSVNPAMAAGPLLRFTPGSGTYSNGDTFKVNVGVDSGTEKSQGVDVWATFDSAKLEIVSIDPLDNASFKFAMGKNIYNDTGKFDLSFISTVMGTYDATAITGDIATITFKTKSTGTANVNFTCQTGSTVDSNIFNMSANDVLDCSQNENGTYTINAGGGTTADPTATPVPSNDNTGDTTTGDEELPQTGSVGTTVGLLIFGIVGVLSSIALRFL